MIKELDLRAMMRVIAFICQDKGLQEFILFILKEDLHQVRGELAQECWAFNVDFHSKQAVAEFRNQIFLMYGISSDLIQTIERSPDLSALIGQVALAQQCLETTMDHLVEKRVQQFNQPKEG